MKKFWLMKTEPDVFSIDDLARSPRMTTSWDGVRNYQARNFMRDEMKEGDEILIYHSNAKPPGIVGLARVSSAPHPDTTAFDKKSEYYDPKSTRENPRWILIDVTFNKKFEKMLSLEEVKNHPKLKDMLVAKKGQRLSIQPVDRVHFQHILKILTS